VAAYRAATERTPARSWVEMRSHYTHPNWWLAVKLVEALVPGLPGIDCLDDLAQLGPFELSPLETDARSDDEIWREFRPQIADRLQGQLIIVTFASFGASLNGPLYIDAGDLDRLVDEHARVLHDPFFSVDVSIWSPASRAVVMVHHDGGFVALTL